MIAAPTASKNRIKLLDALRGIAVLGIVLMNIYIGGHYWEISNIRELIHRPMSADFISTMLAQTLFEGKMRAMFCILFGAGLMLFFTQKKSAGANAAKLHFIRMFWLLMFGLFNAYALFYHYDILYYYGLLGIPLFFIRNLSPKAKLLLLIPILVYGIVMENIDYKEERQSRLEYVSLIQQKENGSSLTESQLQTIKTWEKDNAFRSVQDMAEETEKMTGSVSDIASVVYPKSYEKQITLFLKRFPDPLALMVIGMVLFQIGFLTGKWQLNRYKRIFLIAYTIGIPLTIWELYEVFKSSLFATIKYEHMEENPIAWSFIVYQFNRIILVLGHAAFIIYIYQKGYLKNLFRRFEAVGRMALTNYLIQSMILVMIFFGFGFKMFDKIGYWELFLIPFFVSILQLWYSPIWLKYFKFGPFEWLWRSLTYRKWQPFKSTYSSKPNVTAQKNY